MPLLEVTLEDPVLSHHYSQSMWFSILLLPEEDSIIEADNLETFFLQEHFEVKAVVCRSVLLNKLLVLTLGWHSKFSICLMEEVTAVFEARLSSVFGFITYSLAELCLHSCLFIGAEGWHL